MNLLYAIAMMLVVLALVLAAGGLLYRGRRSQQAGAALQSALDNAQHVEQDNAAKVGWWRQRLTDLAAIGQIGRMRLSQRCGADCRPKFSIKAVDRTADGSLDLAAGLFDGEGRQFVLQVAKVLRELQAENIGACRQYLTQFDRDRS